MSPRLPQKLCPLMSITLILANVAVFVAQVMSGVSMLSPETQEMIDWGANLAPLTLTGEHWRLWASLFLHVGIVHLLFNMAILASWGAAAESFFGRFNFLLLYLVTGLGAALCSALWHGYYHVSSERWTPLGFMAVDELRLVVSAGASGALMGIGGAWLGMTGAPAKFPGAERIEAKNLFVVIAINIGIGFIQPGIDNAAHIGGFLSGLFLAQFFRLVWTRIFFERLLQAILSGLLILIAVYGTPQSFANDELHELREALEAEEKAIARKKYREDMRERQRLAAREDQKNALPYVSKEEAFGEFILLKTPFDVMQVGASEQYLYLVNLLGREISILDLQKKAVLHSFKLPAPKSRREPCVERLCEFTDDDQMTVAVSRDEGLLYLPLSEYGQVDVVSLKTGALVAEIPVGRFPHSVALSPDEKRLYVLNAMDESVSIVDLESHTVLMTKAFGQGGRNIYATGAGMQLSADGRALYVMDTSRTEILRMNTKTLDLEARLALRGEIQTLRLSPDQKTLWVLGYSALFNIDPGTLSLRSQQGLCTPSSGFFSSFAVSPEGRRLAFPHLYRGSGLELVNPDSAEVAENYPLWNVPEHIVFSKKRKSIWVLYGRGANRLGFVTGVQLLDRTKHMDPGARMSMESGASSRRLCDAEE